MSSRVDTKGLDNFIKALNQDLTLRIGVLGEKPRQQTLSFEQVKNLEKPHKSEGPTNAEIGAKHEFGSDGMPIRSFLRMPLTDYLVKNLGNANLFTEEVLEKVVKDKSLEGVVKVIGVVAEETVQQAFDSGGFGQWPKWKGNYESKTGQILVDSTQLRKSISSEIIK